MSSFSILNSDKIQHKINRIAHEINEQVYGEKHIYLVGIKDGGSLLGHRIMDVLNTLNNEPKFSYIDLEINKSNPLINEPKLSIDKNILNNECVILIDDVLNSGKTLMYSANYLLTVPIKRLITAVFVERKHRKFPIRADIVGVTLSTTLEEHITITLDKGKDKIILS